MEPRLYVFLDLQMPSCLPIIGEAKATLRSNGLTRRQHQGRSDDITMPRYYEN